ncbi:MAG: pilus assembly protein [Pseudomonadota bacterium]
MNIIAKIKTFFADEDGAVTVDWVVLTAALVGLGIAVLAAVETGLDDLSNDIASELQEDIIDTTFD